MLPDQILKFFAQFIEKEIGIIYADHNYYQLQSRLEEVSKLQGLKDVQQLYEMAAANINAKLKQQLLDISTNNETSFFRDEKIFGTIENVVFKNFYQANPNGKLNIWSAASSTGQEAVSIAILLSEWMSKQGTKADFQITGTDISERVLAKASSGKYTQLEVQRGMPINLLIKYFEKVDPTTWRPIPKISSQINFSQVNLKQTFTFPRPFDMILCRNMLIYQNIESKIDIISRLTTVLADGGYLILGSGESLLGLSSVYEQIAVGGAVIYQKKGKQKSAA
jgi:chemotaxis protein methyltransferase CheR